MNIPMQAEPVHIKEVEPFKYLFTVFTPSYNREKTLPMVYNSLKNQTFRDFEWLIIDDGSSDNTKAVIEELKKDADFPIEYYYQENKGKHMALNKAFILAKGEMFIILDSDDACIPEALERFKFYWESIPEDIRGEFCACSGLCKDQFGNIVGSRFPQDILDSDSNEIYYRYKVYGEKWGFCKTAILREYPFPEVADIKSIPESVVWSQIGKKYKFRFFNEALRIYYRNDEQFISRFFTVDKKLDRETHIYHGYKSYSIINNAIKCFKYMPTRYFLESRLYSRYSFHLGQSIFKQFLRLDNTASRLLWASMLPVGYLMYIKDKTIK